MGHLISLQIQHHYLFGKVTIEVVCILIYWKYYMYINSDILTLKHIFLVRFKFP